MFQPNSGFVSNQDSSARRSTCSPTTTITLLAGSTGAETGDGSTLAAFSSAAIVPSVPHQVRWRVVVPSSVIETGVSGLRPWVTSAAAEAGTEPRTVRTTSVDSQAPRSAQTDSASRPPQSTKRTSAPCAPARSGTPA